MQDRTKSRNKRLTLRVFLEIKLVKKTVFLYFMASCGRSNSIGLINPNLTSTR